MVLGGLTDGKYHRFKLGRKSTSKKYNTEKFSLLREDGRKTLHSIYRYMDKPDAIQAASGDMAMDFIGLRLVDDKKKKKEDRIIVREEKEESSKFQSYVALVTYMEDQITDAGYKMVGEPRYSSEGSKYTGIIVQFGKGAYLFGFMAENGKFTFQYSHKKVVKEDITVPFSTLPEAKKLVRDFLSCIPQVVGEIKSKATPPAPPQPSEKTLKIVKEVGEYAIAQFKSKLNAKFYQTPPLAQTTFGYMVMQGYETPKEYKLPYSWYFVIEKLDKDDPIKLRIFSDKSAIDLVEKKPLKIIIEIKTAAQGKKAIDNFILCVQDRVEKEAVTKPVTKFLKEKAKPVTKPTAKPKPKPKAKPKKRRSYSRKPKTHVVIWDGKKTTVKTDRASNVWATYRDEEDYDMITHLPSGFDVFEASSPYEAREVMTELGKKFKNWKIDLDLGVKPSKEEIKTIRKFLEQFE